MKKYLGLFAASIFISASVPAVEKSSKDSFANDVECSYQCFGASWQKETVRELFDPPQWGLVRGNGALWAPLAVGVWQWGQTVCRDLAAEKCPQGQHPEFKLEGLRSGTWSLNDLPSCPKKCSTPPAPLLSPYAEQIQLLPTQNLAWKPRSLPTYPEARQMGKNEKCAKPITGKICFGDCMLSQKTQDGLPETLLTLCTSEPGAQAKVQVCADTWIKSLNEQEKWHASSSSLNLSCERYFWQALRTGPDGRSFAPAVCAAVRGESSCRDLVSKMLRNRRVAPLEHDNATQH